MISNQIEHRINDLLKLTGVSDDLALEELTDHYLSHIEAEVKRGVNAQQAVRETFQEIANLDTSQFQTTETKKDRRGLFFILLIFLGIMTFLFYQNQTQQILQPKEEISNIQPPSGSPLAYSDLNISSEFGLRKNVRRQRMELHKGIDILANIGAVVLATGDGIIKEAGYKTKTGNYIIVQHDGDFTTKYYHLSDIKVSSCDEVREGQIIGEVGNSGLSMMPHLHYEVLKGNQPVNPREYISP